MHGRLMIVCEKERVVETTKLVDMMLDFMKQEFDVVSKDLTCSADKFSKWVGCTTPKNANRHPARSGTLIFGKGGRLKETVNSFLEGSSETFTSGLVPPVASTVKKPDLSRPPTAMMARSRDRPHIDPLEFTPTAAKTWATANTWTKVTRKPYGNGRKKNQGQKRQQAPAKEIIEIDNATSSTVSMSSGTQAALDAMRQSVRTLENDRKQNDNKIATLDSTMAQIARDVTALSESQRKANSEYIHIKEQILNIAKDSGEMRKEMLDMKSMIMCIAEHLGGVTTQVTQADQTQHQQ